MASEELQIVRLRDEFYRDGFYKVLIAIGMVASAIALLVAVSLYLIFSKPKPVVFLVGNEWRVLAPVPVDQPYLKTPDLIQWVSRVMPRAFTYDFVNYQKQLQSNMPFFTGTGWKKLVELLNTYANYNTIQTNKLFVNASPTGAPFIVNQGALQGRYAWWVQIPLVIASSNFEKASTQNLVLQVLVVRVPTLNNLAGVGIDNLVVTTEETNQAQTNAL